jgi:hypothetical protein
MDHSDAVNQMAVEQYLLGELTPDLRDAFEAHLFDCPECAQDLRIADIFVEEAKVQLPSLTTDSVAPLTIAAADLDSPINTGSKSSAGSIWDAWFQWLRPSFAAPAFAALILLIGYQNLVTLPALRHSASQPHLLASVALHGATRGADHQQIAADPSQGLALPVTLDSDLAGQPGLPAFAAYRLDLQDSAGKSLWSRQTTSPAPNADGQRQLLLDLPAAMLHEATYTVAVSGIADNGESTPVARYIFDLHFLPQSH